MTLIKKIKKLRKEFKKAAAKKAQNKKTHDYCATQGINYDPKADVFKL